MVVCHCNVVSDRVIRSEIAAGAADLDAIAARCNAGNHCGGCRPMLEELIAETTVEIRSLVSTAA